MAYFLAQQPTNDVSVDFIADAGRVRMLITLEPHRDPAWTERALAGWTSQLTKLPAVFAARGRSRAAG